MDFNIEMLGADALIRLLKKAPVKALPKMATALYEEAQLVLADSQNRLVPVHYGDLARSAGIQPPRMEGSKVIVEFGYGGAASAYALAVHEMVASPSGNPINWTKAGTGAKYLENPTRAAIPNIEQRIFRKLSQLLKEKF